MQAIALQRALSEVHVFSGAPRSAGTLPLARRAGLPQKKSHAAP
jgi:hypothetical protein